MKLSTLALVASTAVAFSDTAAFYGSVGLDSAVSKYITPSSDLNGLLAQFTLDFCSANTDEKVYLFRVNRLKRVAPSIESGKYIKHVQYNSGSELDLDIAQDCVVHYFDAKPTDVADLPGKVIVVDIEDDEDHTIDEFLGEKYTFVQGKPRFDSRVDSLKDYLREKIHGLEELSKRSSAEDIEEDEATLEEVESDFRAAEAMLAAQESDAMVTALSDDHTLGVSGNRKNSTTHRSNLFTNYQFFTPGVWLALIVSFFLLYVAFTAVNWITSIELSYKSFTKQVEYEKKTE